MITMEIFVISDTHFDHTNIISYSNRPFVNTASMDNAIIQNWNSVVSDDDIVYFLGDFTFGPKENIMKYATQLKGHKHLILGNHDRQKQLYLDAGFESVYKETFLALPEIGSLGIFLTHKPKMELEDKCVNIHGHIHDHQLDPLMFDTEKYFNVSVENINYTPIKLQDIITTKGW